MIVHFPNVERQKSRAEGQKDIGKISLQENARKKRRFCIVNLSMKKGIGNNTWDGYDC